MARFDDNQETQYAYGEMFNYDFAKVDLPGREYFDNIDDHSLFVEGVTARACGLGYQTDADLIDFLLKLCKDAGVTLSRQTITNWISKGAPASGESGRENVYKLCFALKMNAEQTAEFFLKAYFERPFNYKNLHEAIYFFCMNTGLAYADATRIIEKVESMQVIENPAAQSITQEIGAALQNLHTEDELVAFLQQNRSGFAVQNKTAIDRINRLLEECYRLATQLEKKKVSNVDELLDAIYGYNARATFSQQDATGKSVSIPVYKRSISDSGLPALIKKNFPQRQQFENISKSKASYDVIRKALIMLRFYYFFATLECRKLSVMDRHDEFVDAMDMDLDECGYIQLYWRNPYDWMFGYCSCADNPLRELKGLIQEYYLDDETIYNA